MNFWGIYPKHSRDTGDRLRGQNLRWAHQCLGDMNVTSPIGSWGYFSAQEVTFWHLYYFQHPCFLSVETQACIQSFITVVWRRLWILLRRPGILVLTWTNSMSSPDVRHVHMKGEERAWALPLSMTPPLQGRLGNVTRLYVQEENMDIGEQWLPLPHVNSLLPAWRANSATEKPSFPWHWNSYRTLASSPDVLTGTLWPSLSEEPKLFGQVAYSTQYPSSASVQNPCSGPCSPDHHSVESQPISCYSWSLDEPNILETTHLFLLWQILPQDLEPVHIPHPEVRWQLPEVSEHDFVWRSGLLPFLDHHRKLVDCFHNWQTHFFS